MTGEIPESEQRIVRRQRVLKQGKILLGNSFAFQDCTLRDMSATGAKLTCADPATVPDAFRLVTPADGMMREVKVAWRRDGHVGVTFTSEPRRAPPRKW